MSDTLPNADQPEKKRGRCCLSCIVILTIVFALLVGLYFLAPTIGQWLGIFGMDAREAYEAAPDLVGSQSLTDTFDDLDIPGVTVYVIPIKGTNTQGAFVILDVSAGYRGTDPLNSGDDKFLQILQGLVAKNRAENLRLAHITGDFRDQDGETATAFTIDIDSIERFADGKITRDQLFRDMEIDLLGTLRYLGVEDILEELQ